MTVTPQELGSRIRRSRKLAVLTLREVSEQLAKNYDMLLTHTSLGRIERGEQKPNLGVLAALAQTYDSCIPRWFGLNSGPEHPQEVARTIVSAQRMLNSMYDDHPD